MFTYKFSPRYFTNDLRRKCNTLLILKHLLHRHASYNVNCKYNHVSVANLCNSTQ